MSKPTQRRKQGAGWLLRLPFRFLCGFLRALKPAGKSDLKRRAATLAALLIVLGLAGALVVVSGIAPIKASSGHWPITEWFLHFSMERSIDTHSLGIDVPPLDDSDLILKGAGHYDAGCMPCHGGPELKQPRVARAMTPHPPYLPNQLPQWESEDLFYLVKHGVKFTGMPAWPSQHRDDEVWAMVAFLRAFPQMDSVEYRRLVYGPAPSEQHVAPLQGLTEPAGTPRIVLENCARCHRADGQARGTGAYPRLAAQTQDYLSASLRAYSAGKRHSGIMETIAAGLNQDEQLEVSRYYSDRPAAGKHESPTDGEMDRKAVERGASIAQKGLPKQRVPPCAECHRRDKQHRNAHYPILDGQFADYLVLQLQLFQRRSRGGTDYAHLMYSVVDGLTAEQMQDVATYYASLTNAAEPAPE